MGKALDVLTGAVRRIHAFLENSIFQSFAVLSGDVGGKKGAVPASGGLYRQKAEKEEVWDMDEKRTVIVRGGGDLATGTSYLLAKRGYRVLVLETEHPACIRRQVAFCEPSMKPL